MNLNEMRYFAAIVECGNMTRAAEKLSVKPCTLSRCIHKLEQHFGTPLLSQTADGYIPTQAGVLYHQAAQRILLLNDELQQELERLKRSQ